MRLFTLSAQTPDVALPVAAFLRRHSRNVRHWPRAVLLGWVRWNLGQGFLGYVTAGEEGGTQRILAVGVARPVMRPQDGLEDYKFDPEGPCLFVDLATTTRRGALPLLLAQARRRFGFRLAVARQMRSGKLSMVPFHALHARAFPKPPATDAATSAS